MSLGNKANDIGVQCGGWTMQWQGARGNITSGTTILGAIEGASKDLGINVTYGNTIPKDAELVILVMGENPYAEFEGDKAEPGLLNTDKVINKTALDSGLPVITILVSGRPLIITEEIENWDALLAAWLPGTEGDGVADILFGKYPVTGKLSFTWPKTMNLYNLREQAKTANNIDFSQDILFPLGFGL
jgi:beta-glucosidase